jgi:hypothetical protein
MVEITEVKNQNHKYKTNYKYSLMPKLLLCSVSKSAFKITNYD